MLNTKRGQSRVEIESVTPHVNEGEFPVKRFVGDSFVVEADGFTDGHDAMTLVLLHRRDDEKSDARWHETLMQPLGNDRWRGAFTVNECGRYCYAVLGWVDRFKTWSRDFAKRAAANQDLSVDVLIGVELVESAAERASGLDATQLQRYADALCGGGDEAVRAAASMELSQLMHRHAERRFATRTQDLPLWVERERARFSAWYEFFPRSCSPVPGQHGTLRDAAARLPYVASMGFDVVYLPPIHPIGRSFRKGRNNTVMAGPHDPGSPWAIGAAEGGHKSIHPQLGTLADFHFLVKEAKTHGMEIALDVAFQCAPEHPYVKEHPQWFRQRPDGSIQYAENPPKKYQDIYPFDFETEDWEAMWDELRSVIQYWIDQGVRIFRVDNPHTKSFGFWAWVIDSIKREYPDVIFLSEAFTRPRVMYRLAKAGFTHSYNYFPWRNTKWELTQFLTELTSPPVSDFFGANLWPNTPDILPESLQYGGRAAFMSRFVLAATLGASYGIYGPAYELQDNTPLAPGKEEYLNSEKYEIKQWDIDRADSLRPLIAKVNRIRRENAALQCHANLRFHQVDNEQIIAYSKTTDDGSSQILVVVNLDPHYKQSGFIELHLGELGLNPHQPYQAHDLLTDARYLWHGGRNYVELDPHNLPAHIFAVRRKVRTEHDFDYYL
jgi:starch synthase (maltosyl-transferring)